MYYICTEIWEEPRLPPFFVTFPLKSGDLGAHPGKIRGRQRKIRGRQRKIRGRQRKIMRRVGKIGRRKVFREVKNVNVESLKIGSKLLDFFVVCRSEESRHLLLPFTVLRLLRLIRSLRSLQTLRTIRSIREIRVLNSIRETRVQKQNVRFVFRFVYSFERSLCRVWNASM